MTLNEIKQTLKTDKRYEFLRTNPHLGENIMVLAIGGSYAYGTNAASSDLDIRGITRNTEREILLGQDIEQVVSHETDTTIYTFKKMIKLLYSNNPTVIEILGLKPEHYLYKHIFFDTLKNNVDKILCRKAAYSFGGYIEKSKKMLDLEKVFIDKDKLAKYMVHPIRLYYMAFDVLENKKIVTYREDEHSLLMDIRNGQFLTDNCKIISIYYDLINQLEERFKYDKENTDLPDTVNKEWVEWYTMFVNKWCVMGGFTFEQYKDH